MNIKNSLYLDKLFNIPFLGGLIPAIALIIPSILFLPQQSLWTDEVTVLSGLTLGPIEILGWLSGQFHTFDVPNDNAPPLGYWVSMAWSSLFGLTEVSLRFFSLLIISLTTLIVYETGRQAFGVKSGFLAGFLFALSPNVIEQAVNIRVYPFYMFLSACSFYCLARLFEEKKDNQYHWLWGIVLFSILAIYSHYFGLLLAGSLMLATLVGKWREGEKLKPVIIGIIVIGISTMGTIPFFIALTNNLGKHFNSSSTNAVYDIFRLIYRQFGHPTMWTYKPALAAIVLGAILLILLAFIHKQVGNLQSFVLLTALCSGMIVIILGRYLVSPLVTEIRYNLWIFPGLCIFISSSVIKSFRFSSIISTIAIFLILGADLYATSQYITKGVYYSHSRFSTINRYIKDIGVNNLTLVHEKKFAAVYFPIIYSYKDQIGQYLIENCQESQPILKKLPHFKPEESFSSISTPYVMFLRTESMGAKKIANFINTGMSPSIECKFSDNLIYSKKWKMFKRVDLVSYFQTEVLIFKKIN